MAPHFGCPAGSNMNLCVLYLSRSNTRFTVYGLSLLIPSSIGSLPSWQSPSGIARWYRSASYLEYLMIVCHHHCQLIISRHGFLIRHTPSPLIPLLSQQRRPVCHSQSYPLEPVPKIGVDVKQPLIDSVLSPLFLCHALPSCLSYIT